MEHPIVVLNHHSVSSPERKSKALPFAFVLPQDSPATAALWVHQQQQQQVSMLQQQQQQQQQQQDYYVEDESISSSSSSSSSEQEEHDDDSIIISCSSSSSSFYDDDDDDDITEEEERQETAVAKALVKAAFDRRLEATVLKRLFASAVKAENNDDSNDVADSYNQDNDNIIIMKEPPLKKQCLRRVSISEPAISSMMPPLDQHDHTVIVQQPPLPSSEQQQQPVVTIKPDDFIKTLVESHGYTYQTFPALELNNFFEPITAESVAAYDMTVLQAVRHQDVTTLQKLHAAGRTLQCGNRFGETLVHTAARRGSYTVLQFLLQQAAVSVRVCCDYGRTALHDACWTTSELSKFDVISLLLDECPDLLYMTDKRGFTPLAYIRATASVEWCRFLQERGVERLLPKELQLKQK